MDELTAIHYADNFSSPDPETTLEALAALGTKPELIDALRKAKTAKRRFDLIMRLDDGMPPVTWLGAHLAGQWGFNVMTRPR